MSTEPPRDANLPPGYDDADPYEDADLDEFPDWWRHNIELFNQHDMRPYRPPRFTDGKILPPVIDALEDEFEITIRIRSENPQRDGVWMIWIDDESIESVDRTREGEGYTKYHLDSQEFKQIVKSHVGSDAHSA
jgi:hypothetical protein